LFSASGKSTSVLVCFRIGVAENTDSRYRRQSHSYQLPSLLFFFGLLLRLFVLVEEKEKERVVMAMRR
jgi:hypothetical protein